MKAKTNKQEIKNQNNNPFFSSPGTNGFLSIQAKYTIGEPGDALETEADQVAERVTNTEPSPFFNPVNSSLVQRRPEITIQEKPSDNSGTATPSAGKEKEKKLLTKSDHINRSPDEETDKKIGDTLEKKHS